MTAPGGWTDAELRRVGEAVELDLASYRPDGGLGPFTTMWAVRVGADLYVRSAGGPDRPWYRHALTSGSGRIRAGGVERDVAFGNVDPDVHDDAGVHDVIDEAYHAKYDRFGPGPVSHVTGLAAHPVTVRLVRSQPSMTVTNDVVMVIGPGSIGQAIARRVSAGKHVVLADLRQANADAAAKTLREAGFDASTTTVDVSSRESVHALVETATGFGDVIASGGAGVVIASQSGHRLGALAPEQNTALATAPAERS